MNIFVLVFCVSIQRYIQSRFEANSFILFPSFVIHHLSKQLFDVYVKERISDTYYQPSSKHKLMFNKVHCSAAKFKEG